MRNRSSYVKGVAVLVAIALLVGVLGTPIPTIAASPGEAIGNVGKGICWVLTLGVCIYFLPIGEPFGTAPPMPITTTCTSPKLMAPPQFLSVPRGAAKYPFDGICTSPQKPGEQMKYRWEGSWSPSETDPNKPNASESITLTNYEPFIPDREPGGRIFMYWTARCSRDPWIDPQEAICRRHGEFIPDDLRTVAPDLHGHPFPRSATVIPPAEKQRLYAKYLERNSPASTRVNPNYKALVPSDDMFIIVTPAPNDRVQQGQVVVKVTPPKVGMTQVTQLEFAWLDAPPNQPYVNNFAVDTNSLLQGYPVPQQVTRGNSGRWKVRARASGKAVPGPWSFPVEFRLFLTQPTQSQKQAPPMVQQAPLPPSSVTQAPAPNSAPPQMRRSPFMTRGVEEKAGEAPAESDKKP